VARIVVFAGSSLIANHRDDLAKVMACSQLNSAVQKRTGEHMCPYLSALAHANNACFTELGTSNAYHWGDDLTADQIAPNP